MTAPRFPAEESAREVRKLLSQLIDGDLTVDDRRRLQELLHDNPDLQDMYCSIMRVHVLLHLDFSAGLENANPPVLRKPLLQASGDDQRLATPETLIAAEERGSRSASRRWLAAAVAAGILFAVGAYLTRESREKKQLFVDGEPATSVESLSAANLSGPPIPTEPKAADGEVRAVAMLSQATGAKWRNASPEIRAGGPLEPGRFKLDEGLIQVEFFTGAVAIIEGPADFELVSADRVICRLGKIRAHVPKHAKGFTIDTPSYAAVDLGTEFTVKVEQEGVSEFHVLDGEVELWDIRPEDRVLAELLTKGNAVRSNIAGNLARIEGRESELIGRKQLLEISEAAQQRRHQEWFAYSRKLRSQPNVLLYYDFDNQDGWEREIRNKSSHDNAILNGAIVGCHWTTGRWNGKSALEFKRTSDRVRINVPGEYASATFSVWVRIEGLERWLSSLMLCDGHEQGELHWQITETGQLLLGVKADPEFSHDFYSPSVINSNDLGRWVHLACVYNGETGSVHHYVDGVEVSAEKITVATPLRIDAAELGNWTPQDYSTHRTRSLNGRVDEFIIFDTPLSAAEVAEIYETGKPGS